MFVVSVEGGRYLDKGNWTTHKVLGVFNTREEAIAEFSVEPSKLIDPSGIDDQDEFERSEDDSVLVLTDMSSGKAERM